jgi:hypothetical protein
MLLELEHACGIGARVRSRLSKAEAEHAAVMMTAINPTKNHLNGTKQPSKSVAAGLLAVTVRPWNVIIQANATTN